MQVKGTKLWSMLVEYVEDNYFMILAIEDNYFMILAIVSLVHVHNLHPGANLHPGVFLAM